MIAENREAVTMLRNPASAEDLVTLVPLLGTTIDPIDQLFLHSRMLRAWGHPAGRTRNGEWIEKMRRSRRLGELVIASGGLPTSRTAQNLVIGGDPGSVLASDRRQGAWFLTLSEAALAQLASEPARALVAETVAAEREDLARLDGWLAGPEAGRPRPPARGPLPKPGHEATAMAALDALLAPMTAAVSQIFFHSMIFAGTGRPAEADRELQAALRMMYRTESVLERLLDLDSLPSGAAHGAMRIDGGPTGADTTAAASHARVLAVLEAHLPQVQGLADPVTWTLLDGLRRATRDETTEIAARLAA